MSASGWPSAARDAERLPLWFKVTYLAFVAALVPIYAGYHGLANFLWFSNVALLGGLAAAWLENRRLANMLAVAVLMPELGWIIGFLSGLVRAGDPLFGITGYMFDAQIPLHVRGFALYHLVLPVLLLWMLWRLGYDAGAWRAWLPFGWGLLLASRLVTTPERNINWTVGPVPDTAGMVWHALWMAALLLASTGVWWVTHKLLAAVFAPTGAGPPRRTDPAR